MLEICCSGLTIQRKYIYRLNSLLDDTKWTLLCWVSVLHCVQLVIAFSIKVCFNYSCVIRISASVAVRSAHSHASINAVFVFTFCNCVLYLWMYWCSCPFSNWCRSVFAIFVFVFCISLCWCIAVFVFAFCICICLLYLCMQLPVLQLMQCKRRIYQTAQETVITECILPWSSSADHTLIIHLSQYIICKYAVTSHIQKYKNLQI